MAATIPEVKQAVEEMQQAALARPGPVGAALTASALALSRIVVQAERAAAPEVAHGMLLGGLIAAVKALGEFQVRLPRFAGEVAGVAFRLSEMSAAAR